MVPRTSIANVVSGIAIIIATVYAAVTRNDQLLRDMAMLAAGYLFGSTIPRMERG